MERDGGICPAYEIADPPPLQSKFFASVHPYVLICNRATCIDNKFIEIQKSSIWYLRLQLNVKIIMIRSSIFIVIVIVQL